MKKLILLSWLMGIWGITNAQSGPVLLDLSRKADTSFYSIFDEVEVIPLETSSGCVFGVVKQLLVTPRCFIIHDADTDALLFFDKRGRFITRYRNSLKRYRIGFIQLDRSNNTLIVFSQNNNYEVSAAKIQRYFSAGSQEDVSKFVRADRLYLDDLRAMRVENLQSAPYFFTNPRVFGSRYAAFSFIKSDTENADTLGHELSIMDDRGAAVRTFFPYNKKTDSLFMGRTAFQCALMPTLVDSVMYVTRPFQPVVYTLTPSSITESYKIVMPKTTRSAGSGGTVPYMLSGNMGFISYTSASGSRKPAPVFNNAVDISNVISFERFLFFNVKQSSLNESQFIFDKTGKRLYDYNRLKPDSSNFIFSLQGNIMAFDEEHIYRSVSARSLINMNKAAEKKKPRYHESLARFYSVARVTDNPVIIRLKPKEKQNVE